MTETEMRELDAWIDTQLFDGGKLVGVKKRGWWYRPNDAGYTNDWTKAGRYTMEDAKGRECPHGEPVTIHQFPVPKYTTDPASTMMVFERCLQELPHGVQISKIQATEYFVWGGELTESGGYELSQHGDTLPLAICLFARQLFSKESK